MIEPMEQSAGAKKTGCDLSGTQGLEFAHSHTVLKTCRANPEKSLCSSRIHQQGSGGLETDMTGSWSRSGTMSSSLYTATKE